MGKKLVVVESDSVLANNIENALSQDFEISISLTGKEGLETIQKEKPDVAIIDFFLPELNGFQLCNELKQSGVIDSIKIVLLVDSEDLGNRIQNTFKTSKYFLKPYNIDEIVDYVKDVAGIDSVTPVDSAVDDDDDDLNFADEDSLKLLDNIFADMGIGDEGEAPVVEEGLPLVEETSEGTDEKTEILSGGTPETNSLPEINESSDDMGLPEINEEPLPTENPIEKTEELPEIPEIDELPEIPEIEEAPAEVLAEETPAVPEIEELPEIPEIKEAPAEVLVEETPAVPEIEKLPEIPAVEEIPAEAPAEEISTASEPAPVEEIKEEVQPAPVEEISEVPAAEKVEVKKEETVVSGSENIEPEQQEEILAEKPV
ncbi:response regulator, partial [bacterium]|nr:response regulator [bacterium]